MKFFSSIMAIIMLVLSCIPCSDAKGFPMEQISVGSSARTTEDHTNNPEAEHEDLCSPFCICSCCAMGYTLPLGAVVEITIKIADPKKVFASYLYQHPVGIALPVWQPPQLV